MAIYQLVLKFQSISKYSTLTASSAASMPPVWPTISPFAMLTLGYLGHPKNPFIVAHSNLLQPTLQTGDPFSISLPS
jgi:hypothetical protein